MKVIDLSTHLYTGMEIFPGDPEVKIQVFHNYEKEGWQLRKIEMGSHTGTHVDVPSHMHKGEYNLDQISVERFFGKAQVVDCSKSLPRNMGLFFIEETEIKSLEKIVKSSPKFVGGNIDEVLERELLKKGIITYTGLVNLEQIPKFTTFDFYGLPLKIKMGDGSPVRAIAILEE